MSTLQLLTRPSVLGALKIPVMEMVFASRMASVPVTVDLAEQLAPFLVVLVMQLTASWHHSALSLAVPNWAAVNALVMSLPQVHTL